MQCSVCQCFPFIPTFLQDKWPYWASLLFSFLTDMVRKAIVRFLNRPGIQQMRQVDEEFYLAPGKSQGFLGMFQVYGEWSTLHTWKRCNTTTYGAMMIMMCAGKNTYDTVFRTNQKE